MNILIEEQQPGQFIFFSVGKSFRLLASTCLWAGIRTAIAIKKKKENEWYQSKGIVATILFHENLKKIFFFLILRWHSVSSFF